MESGKQVSKYKVGQLLINEGVLSEEQLKKALEFQAKSATYVPIGEACIRLNLLSRVRLRQILKKYRQRIMLGDLMINLGLISKEQLEEALEKQKLHGKKLGEVLLLEGYISEMTLLNVVSLQLGIPKIIPSPKIIDKSLFGLLQPEFCRKNEVIPAFKEDGRLMVIMSNPLNETLIDTIERVVQMPVEPAVASTREIRSTLNLMLGFKDDKYLPKDDVDKLIIKENDIREEEGENAVDAVNFIITQAVLEKASDIHVEPMADRLRVRYRIDGVMQHRTDLPLSLTPNIIARIKALCGVDIGERHRHQDGRISAKFLGRNIDLRISTYVTIYGENVVVRILDQDSFGVFDLNQLGFTPANLEQFQNQLNMPTGIILVTGPTGCGKTTSMYASLYQLNDMGRVVITVEDPVELAIEGVIQAQMNTRGKLTYSDYIKAMMRQDPDVLMVGEIRDKEAAETVVQCALTGHKVLTTFHTDDTTGALLRLLDMGINTFLISSTVVSVCSQRLVRILCPMCKREANLDDASINSLCVDPLDVMSATFYEAEGCPYCNYSGYKGRTAIHELLVVNDDIRNAILSGQTSSKIRHVSRISANMVSMQEDGVYKALKGMTSISEILRVCTHHEVDKKTMRSLDALVRLCEGEDIPAPKTEVVQPVREAEQLAAPEPALLDFRSEIDKLEKIGRYEIKERLGWGGAGMVFLAWDPFIKRNVAIKVSHGSSEMYRKIFFQEARAAGQLSHPNIVTVYDYGLHEDLCYIVMEYISGVSLKGYCSSDNLLPVGQVVEIICSACQALQYAHRQGVVHKDLKPSNIMLDTVGAVKITDFGVAQLMDSDYRVVTAIESDPDGDGDRDAKPVQVHGTPGYMAPEQLKSNVVERESDIFSLGCVLYELLAGKKAFTGDNLVEITDKVLNHNPHPVTSINPALPAEFDDVLALALKKEPEHRHLNCADLAHHLRNAYKQIQHQDPDSKDFFDFVNSAPFFVNFTRDHIRELVTASNVIRIDPGQVVIREGEIDDTFFVVLNGRLRMIKEGVLLDTLERGDCFGEVAVLNNQYQWATVESETKCTLLKIKSSLLSKSSDDVQLLFYQRFAKNLSKQITAF